MQTAKRYDNTSDDTWIESKDGEFVTIDDYNELYRRHLEMQIKELHEEYLKIQNAPYFGENGELARRRDLERIRRQAIQFKKDWVKYADRVIAKMRIDKPNES